MEYLSVIFDVVNLIGIAYLLRLLTKTPPAQSSPVSTTARHIVPPPTHSNSGEYEILVKERDEWRLVGMRPPAHPDINEALCTRGLAVRRPDGSLDLGEQ